jgi:VWFA-related protein
MHVSRNRLFSLTSAAIFWMTLQAQAPGPTPAAPSTEPYVLRSETQLIQISVVVQDKKGEPVKDLKQTDFELLDKGKPVPIAFFSVESADKVERTTVKLPPNVFSNRLGARGDAPTSVTAIVIDGLNTTLMDQTYARGEILKFLKQLRPEDRVGLYSLGSGLRVIHDYTTDTASLLKILDKHGAQLFAALNASSREFDEMTARMLIDFPEFADQMRRMQDQQAAFFTGHRVRATMGALRTIAEHLAILPGRKNVIWVSNGFPLNFGLEDLGEGQRPQISREWQTYGGEVELILRTINQANVAIYPVDAAGLVGPKIANAAVAMGIPGQPIQRPGTVSSINPNHDTMRLVADRTGGRAAYNTNDIATAIRRAVDDSRVSYTLAFYPSATDNKWHDLKVRVKRPDVQVRHRQGYLSIPQTKPSQSTREASIQSAVWSPLESTAIPVNARVDLVDDGKALEILLQIDITGVGLDTKDDRLLDTLYVEFIQKDETGKHLHGKADRLDLNLKTETFRKLLDSGLLYRQRVPRDPKLSTLKIVVFDGNTGRVGSLAAPVSRIKAAATP